MAPEPMLERLASKGRRLPSRIRRLPVSVGYYRGPRLMSELRKRRVLFRNPDADIRLRRGASLGPRFSLPRAGGGTFITGEGVEFRRGFRAETGPNGRIEIGSG